MANKDPFQKYLDAGIAFTNMTRAKAEELVQELVKSGEFQGSDARAWVDDLLERSRKSREALLVQVRHEVSGRAATTGKKGAGKKSAAKKSPAKKAGAKKAAAKKSPAKKAAAKKAVAKKSPAKKAAVKKAPPAAGRDSGSAD